MESLQLDEVNTFVYANLDKIVLIIISPGYVQSGKVLRLSKELYNLRQSSLLWQQKRSKKMKKLGFKKIL